MRIAVALATPWFFVGHQTLTSLALGHSDSHRTMCLAAAIADLGHDVTVLSSSPNDSGNSAWQFRVCHAPVADPREYDILIDMHGLLHEQEWGAAWIAAGVPRVYYGGSFDIARRGPVARWYAVETPSEVRIGQYRNAFGAASVFRVPVSGAVWPVAPLPRAESPITRVFVLGTLHLQAVVDTLNDLATCSDLEIWMAILVHPQHVLRRPSGSPLIGVTDRERADLFHARLRWVSDEVGAVPQWGHGPVRAGAYAPRMLSCDVGLSLFEGPVANSRVHEYALNGIPAVVNPGAAEAWTVQRYDLGAVVPWSTSALADACRATRMDRNDLAARARRHIGMPTVAAAILREVQA